MAGIQKKYYYFLKWVFIRETKIYEDKTKKSKWIIKKRK
jgi:hypothetical protein